MDGDEGVMVVTMASISPSPEANSASRLALRGRTEGLRQLRGVDRKKGSASRVSTPRGLYRPRGASGGLPGQSGGCLARPPWAAPATLLAGWQWPRGPSSVIPEGSIMETFNMNFLEFFWHFKSPENLKNKNNTAALLKTASVRVSSVQIVQ